MEADGLPQSPVNEARLKSRSSGLELQSDLWTIPSSDLQKFERVGSGTYGQVYRGRWEHMAEDDVAIKELIAPVKDSTVFEREVQLMINLPHPNLLRIYGYCLDPSYIVIEFCHRGSLYDVLNDHTEHPELTWQLRLQIARRIAQGMSFMHSHNVLHRDLKSPNVMLTGDWAVKIADFGYARHCRSSVATSGTRPSNPIWVDPELLRNPERPCDTSTDVYSFGIILHELLFLELPCGHLLKEQHGLFKLMARLVYMREDISSFFDFGDERLPEGRRTPGIDAYLQLLRDCVKLEAHERPPFKIITAALNDIIASESPLPQTTIGSFLDPYGRTSYDFPLDDTSSTLRGSGDTMKESYGNPTRTEDDHAHGESPIHEMGSSDDKPVLPPIVVNPVLQGLTDYEARCVGMVMGTMCGDVLGSPFEGADYDEIAQQNPSGVKDFAPSMKGTGVYTEDTQLTLAVAKSLIRRGKVDAEDVSHQCAQDHEPWRGYGGASGEILQVIRDRRATYKETGTMFKVNGSFGNGGAMRIAPVGLAYRNVAYPDALYCAVRDTIMCTHVHSDAIDGAFTQAAAVAYLATHGPEATPFDLLTHLVEYLTHPQLRQLRQINQVQDEELCGSKIEVRLQMLMKLTDPREQNNVVTTAPFGGCVNWEHDLESEASKLDRKVLELLSEQDFQINAVDAVSCALYALIRHWECAEAAVIGAVHYGGDTDTIAAMTGAMAGARHGVTWIPKRWFDALENGPNGRDDAIRLAVDLAKLDVRWHSK